MFKLCEYDIKKITKTQKAGVIVKQLRILRYVSQVFYFSVDNFLRRNRLSLFFVVVVIISFICVL